MPAEPELVADNRLEFIFSVWVITTYALVTLIEILGTDGDYKFLLVLQKFARCQWSTSSLPVVQELESGGYCQFLPLFRKRSSSCFTLGSLSKSSTNFSNHETSGIFITARIFIVKLRQSKSGYVVQDFALIFVHTVSASPLCHVALKMAFPSDMFTFPVFGFAFNKLVQPTCGNPADKESGHTVWSAAGWYMQRDLNKSEDWAVTNHMKFSKRKYWILHLEYGNPGCSCRLGNEMLAGNAMERDLVDGKLNISQQCPGSQEGQPCPGGHQAQHW
ncbi:hypothetical protein WISP_146133 [Willisornis vidua]|uniref:Uncharacterized protein n=1 Tax=Willisornis vidua TaxID=1566151 RepID=A0ABQ9CRB1_9PASS|nr:hypothetical protein WISP_146133 [Willisornis vidua]